MRILVFVGLLGITVSNPQGYNYQQQGLFSSAMTHAGRLPLTAVSSSSPSFQSGSHSSTQEGLGFLQQALGTSKLTQTLLGGIQQHSLGQSNFIQKPQQSIIPQSFGITPLQPQQQTYQQNFNGPSPVVTKDIYVHVAPEEPEEKFTQQHFVPAPQRKHYRIVFIKAPTPKLSSGAALRLQQAPIDEKTIIYVLTKKPDPLDLDTVLQESAPKPPSKPEVYFIKYKTQEEAQHAQRTIQAQYDKLGGTTQISDEGVAPVTSVIGALDQSAGASHSDDGLNNSGSLGTYSATQGITGANTLNFAKTNNYLPPIVRL